MCENRKMRRGEEITWLEDIPVLISWDEDAPRLQVTPALQLTLSAEVVVTDPPVGQVEVLIEYDEHLERLVARRVSVSSMSGDEVTGTMLRAVRVHELVETAAPTMLYRMSEVDGWSNHGALFPDDELDAAKTSATARIELAARIYTVSRLINQRPVKNVADYLEVSTSTATRLVAEARKRGWLDG